MSVSKVAKARDAADAGADAVIVQRSEARGHNKNTTGRAVEEYQTMIAGNKVAAVPYAS